MNVETGLVSITFRQLAPERIVELVAQSGLKGIEWGGDVHVPHGDLDAARRTGGITREAGLEVCSYGAYYRAAESEAKGLPFTAVLDTARQLGAPLVRVWAGARGSADADESYREAVTADLNRISRLAGKARIAVACEYHGGTLTDTLESTQRLLHETAGSGVQSYWQPPVQQTIEQREQGLTSVLPRLANVHVFHWALEDGEVVRRPLAEGRAEWRGYVSKLASTARTHWLLLEFVRNADPAQFLNDAETMRELVAERGSEINSDEEPAGTR